MALLCACKPPPAEDEAHTVTRGPLRVWSVYSGKLDARRVEVIMSKFQGLATIVEIAPEGQTVKAGDLLVRFDSSQVERDLVKLERDYQLAKTDLERLEKAEQPLELADLEARRSEAQAALEVEQQFLEDAAALLAEELIAPQEIDQQRRKVEQLRAALEKIEQRIALTRDFLHPAARERARATLAAAEQELALARQQWSNCTVYAPCDGVVVYRPLHVGGEFRAVRVGDGLYRNQPFMSVSDLREAVVEILVPEAELARVQPGCSAVISPISYPDVRLAGTVESVGSMAVAAVERPGWQRYFRAVIGLRESDPRLRSGMSVQAEILSYEKADALLVPRRFVRFEGGEAFVRPGGREAGRRRIRIGWGDLRHFEVVEGLEVGDRILYPP